MPKLKSIKKTKKTKKTRKYKTMRLKGGMFNTPNPDKTFADNLKDYTRKWHDTGKFMKNNYYPGMFSKFGIIPNFTFNEKYYEDEKKYNTPNPDKTFAENLKDFNRKWHGTGFFLKNTYYPGSFSNFGIIPNFVFNKKYYEDEEKFNQDQTQEQKDFDFDN